MGMADGYNCLIYHIMTEWLLVIFTAALIVVVVVNTAVVAFITVGRASAEEMHR